MFVDLICHAEKIFSRDLGEASVSNSTYGRYLQPRHVTVSGRPPKIGATDLLTG